MIMRACKVCSYELEFDALISQFVTEASKNCIARPAASQPTTACCFLLSPKPTATPTIWHGCCRTSVARCLTFCVCSDMRAHKFAQARQEQEQE